MKRFLFLLVFIPVFGFSQYTAIPDENFEQALIDLGYDNVIDGQVLTSSISSITNLDVSNKSIQDLTGIEDFTSLINLDCSDNFLSSLNLGQKQNLKDLECQSNQLTSINISNWKRRS